jgi:hypothetical protein
MQAGSIKEMLKAAVGKRGAKDRGYQKEKKRKCAQN